MTTHLTQGRLIIQDENLHIHNKKAVVDGKTKSSKPATKKGGAGFGSRKALNDITNKSSLQHEASSSRKKDLLKNEFNIAEEMFLHDHKKCIEEQRRAMEPCFLDTVLPGHDSVSSVQFPESELTKTDIDSPRCYPEPVELPMFEFSDWLESSSRWDSPRSSPILWDSLLSSPFKWDFEPVEFRLKQEDDC
uniref:Protein PATRONUS 2 n=1 Tax=Davidia involucrata TaxID=16924 RepID=A0A5B7BRK1_DAVIN